MVNWEKELKKFLAKKFNEIFDDEDMQISPENIQTVDVEFEVDVNLLTEGELLHIYAFAMMREDFEYAKKMSDELKKRGYAVKMNLDEKNKNGSIEMISNANENTPLISIPILLHPEGIMIDFESEEF